MNGFDMDAIVIEGKPYHSVPSRYLSSISNGEFKSYAISLEAGIYGVYPLAVSALAVNYMWWSSCGRGNMCGHKIGISTRGSLRSRLLAVLEMRVPNGECNRGILGQCAFVSC